MLGSDSYSQRHKICQKSAFLHLCHKLLFYPLNIYSWLLNLKNILNILICHYNINSIQYTNFNHFKYQL